MDLVGKYKEDLVNSIPVVSGMDVDIELLGHDSITLRAPLNKNINYEGTAFGGSINTLCILSCYLLAHHLMKVEGIPFSSLVIQRSQIEYLSPVQEDFFATASFAENSKKLFLKSLNRKGVGRIKIQSLIRVKGSDQVNVEFNGEFVAKI